MSAAVCRSDRVGCGDGVASIEDTTGGEREGCWGLAKRLEDQETVADRRIDVDVDGFAQRRWRASRSALIASAGVRKARVGMGEVCGCYCCEEVNEQCCEEMTG